MKHLCRNLLGAALLAGSLNASAQGLEGIIVEDYYTISAADADYLNNTVGVTYPINVGTKVYRIYVDMAPNYKLNTVNGSPLPQGGGNSPNPLDFTTTTTFWNEDGFGTEVPPQTSRFDDGAAFDSYITIGLSGRSGGAVGCGANTQQAGVLKTADTNGNLTLCSVYSGFPSGAGTPDGNMPPSAAIPALTYNLGGAIDFTALQADGNQLVVIGDAWATLPNGTGVDGAGTNRVLIAQLTTDGQLSFHINVQLQAPGGALETYVWNQAGSGEVVSPFLTYPQVAQPDCNGVIGGPALPGTSCNDNNACTINDTWSQSCVCQGTVQDTDGDGTCDANDGCPNDPNKTAPGICGCGVADTDSDGDGVANCNDNCPNVSGQQGSACNDNNACTINDVLNASCVCAGTFQDTDGDGTCDANDGCPNDPNKIAPGICGCGVADTDSDNDGIANCNDPCPNGPNPGTSCNDNNACTINDVIQANCTCAGTIQDTDGDGTCDANDGCPNDPNKITAGICGCGVADTDSDNDGTPNCNDGCPNDPNKIAAGICGCGVADTDSDSDGIPNCNDNCPNVTGQIGSACNDGNPNTSGDVINANCVCEGSTIPCPDDGNACTSEVVVNGQCTHPALPDGDGDGTCDLVDGCPNDPNKIAPGICGCGVPDTDSDNDGVANCNDNCPNVVGQIGSTCDDGNANTSGDVINVNCVCEGTQTFDCPALGLNIGDPCDDNNANTTGDVVTANCVCAGTLANDCNGVPGGPAQPGTPCNDNNVCTVNDVYQANCSCAGTVQDTDSDGTCDANDGCPNDPNKIAPGICGCGVADTDTDNDGTANCNDGCPTDPNKIAPGICGCGIADTDSDNDGVANCDDNCPNVAGQIGSTCDDGNSNTVNDMLNANCQCIGTPIGGCTENLTLSVKLDGAPQQTTWQLFDQTETTVVASGGFSANQANTTVNVPICVPAGCYHLKVNDSGNDGINNGGYVLRDAQSRRIIDASLGSFTSVSQINTGNNPNRTFCVPIGNIGILGNACDKTRARTSPITCNTQPGATAYQFWIYDPHGTYNRRIQKPTSNLVPSTVVTDPVPSGLDLNVRARALVNNVYQEFGPACRFRLTGGTREVEFVDQEVAGMPSISLFPNPNSDGEVTLSINGIDVTENTPAVITVYDMLGKNVRDEQVTTNEGSLYHTLHLGASLQPGIYMVAITIDGQRFTQRMTKN